MKLSRRQILKIGLWLPLLSLSRKLTGTVLADATHHLNALDGEDIVFGHIADEHLCEADPGCVQPLKDILEVIKALTPAFVLDTGDLTDDNRVVSFDMYHQAFDDIGGFNKYPDYSPGIPLKCVAGNHDYYGIEPYPDCAGPTEHSFTVGNYRFIGFSGNPDWSLPEEWLESEMQQSCFDGKCIVLFHHHPPHGWMVDRPDLDISAETWAKIDALAQKYPIVAYLAGHNHFDRTEVMAPGYVVHTSGRVRTNFFTIYSLSNGTINIHTKPHDHTPLIITRPAEFRQGLDYTKTKAEPTKVRAYVKARSGQVTHVRYKFDGGAEINMQRIGSTSYYEADLDASGLSDQHTIEVTGYHSLGSWAHGTHTIVCCFADDVPQRPIPRCGSESISLSLVEGWNLISVPFVPLDSTLTVVLSAIEGKYTQVYTYDALDEENPWKRYNPAALSILNDLDTIEAKKGYWLQMTSPATLNITGNPLESTAISLKTGWNLVGYPSHTTCPIADALSSIDGKYNRVYTFDGTSPGDPWKEFNVEAALATNQLTQMEPGVGYWIHATEDCVWELQ